MRVGEERLEDLRVGEQELWLHGPPHDTFRTLRSQCPVHWSDGITMYPSEAGFWSVTKAEDIRTVSLDWETYSSAQGITAVSDAVLPVELISAMFIGMDPPRHDRLKKLFQKGFTPRRIAEHEDEIRAITVRVLEDVGQRDEVELVEEVAQRVVSRVIGTFMGIPEEDDAPWARLMNAIVVAGDDEDGKEWEPRRLMEKEIPLLFERCQSLIEDRRANPGDDLTSVLVHAEVDGERLEDHEIVMGFFLLMAAGNDSTKATFSAAMKALMEHPEERQKLLDDPSLVPSAVEEALRMFPAFGHFRRTATKDAELGGCPIKAGDKVVLWYPSSNRDEDVYDDPDRFDVERNPDHQAFGAGGRHFCLGAALARLELKVLVEETLRLYPRMELAGRPVWAPSPFANQLLTLPVRLQP